jgi:ubiquinone/menaquinone biosynthesis C-methylase UbiE
MTVKEAVDLIKPGVEQKASIWADFGAGSGTFTLALAEILGYHSMIYAVDQQLQMLKKKKQDMYTRSQILLYETDFRTPLEFPPLDGVVMANALHYLEDQIGIVTNIYSYLKPGGSLILVEYDSEVANNWVPFPVTFIDFHRICLKAQFGIPEEIGRKPSIYPNKELYAAVAIKSQ